MRCTLDAISESVTGGKWCSRASNFLDADIPSDKALGHRAMRARLLYEFIAEDEGLCRAEKRARDPDVDTSGPAERKRR